MARPTLLPMVGIRYICVIDKNGQTSGADGTSDSISNAPDRELLIEARRVSQLIITDVATAVAENYRASRYAPIEIWNQTGNTRGFEPQSSPGAQPVRFVRIVDLTNEANRIASTACLLESGRTLTGKLASFIDQAVITVAGGPNSSQIADAYLDEIGATQLREKLWSTDGINGYLVASRRG